MALRVVPPKVKAQPEAEAKAEKSPEPEVSDAPALSAFQKLAARFRG